MNISLPSRFLWLFGAAFWGLFLACFAFYPQMDLWMSSQFGASDGFFMRDALLLRGLEKLAFYGSRLLGAVLFIGAIVLLLRKGRAAAKPWFFLFVCLLVGPGLIANLVLKDHWGRARPRDIAAFGGSKAFTPAFVVADACNRNCSFVSGDASFGFFLTSFAYLAPPRKRRRVFWGAMGLGVAFGGARLLIGAHFLSDILVAATLVVLLGAVLHAAFYGWQETRCAWKDFTRIFEPVP